MPIEPYRSVATQSSQPHDPESGTKWGRLSLCPALQVPGQPGPRRRGACAAGITDLIGIEAPPELLGIHTNMPGAVPRTSTFALTNATLPYALKLAQLGLKNAIASDPGLGEGVNVYQGHVTCRGVAESQNLGYTPVRDLLN